ncbi:protein of unknown function [Bacteroidales bacterium WCE2008]|nr:protein of unknown function [Bacteroidales bacterium WCE2008]
MSDEKNPEVIKTSDVAENAEVKNTVENVVEKAEEVVEQVVNYAEKSLSELTSLFEELMSDEARMKRIKEAEAIKAAFYKKLSKEKEEAGFSGSVEEPGEEISAVEQVAEEEAKAAPAESDPEKVNPFEAIESGFKSLYNKFRKERAEFNRQLDEERSENLAKKQAVVEELKALVEKQEDVSASFPEFRALQSRWREIGPVPQTEFRNLNDTYQFYVEKFYDKVQINRDMRDLDFKKNLEAKEKFCEQAEELAASENVVDAFKELQKLHEQWKELGPVAKEFRESIWERFKAATAVINRKYQAYFEEQKGKQVENLAAKAALCEKVEAIADKAEILTSNEWNSLSKEIEDIQKEWRTIGFATRKENQKIYDRFRAACDKFFERKRVFYSDFKNNMNENLEKKMALIEEAEKLKTSTDWKKTTELFIELQKKWKEIGAVPRKKSEVIWKRFRAACDEYFAERDKNAKPENDFYGNLKAKKALVDEIKAFVRSDDEQVNSGAYQSYMEKWNAIGFVPFKEKDSINQAFREAIQEKFPDMSRGGRRERPQAGRGRGQKVPMSEKDRLVQQYNKLQQEIETYENNIGFFAESKNAAPLIRQMQDKIEGAKEELKSLELKIREIEDAQEQ